MLDVETPNLWIELRDFCCDTSTFVAKNAFRRGGQFRNTGATPALTVFRSNIGYVVCAAVRRRDGIC